MNQIKLEVTVDKYYTTIGKPSSKATRVSVPKEFLGLYLCIIPLPYDASEKYIKLDDEGGYKINVFSDRIIIKEAKVSKKTGKVYIPEEFVGAKLLVFETPYYEY